MTQVQTDKAECLALTGALAEAYSANDPQAVASLFAENAVFYNSNGTNHVGRDSILNATHEIMSMGGLHFVVKDAVVEEAVGKVVTHWLLIISGPTGPVAKLEGTDVLHWADGLLVYKSAFLKTGAPKHMPA
ncbi:conserved hypothetical protein [Aliiroseovarius halocynthiae]|uniref:Nuclear transport factor 2 family protein n=1 Tax=Aliiroseovarius halocynthiae TaxID=985055 RepID=A0A545SZF6_9RHOB|nr:nuclear transport factor 2 family protein [Aliiroseovarius halocynthiae]TQV70330.1 nuclear transport factor 2 family protein [Aliiroseovarius halocynthiae]SMR81996.1 conserved hypothetical protein [Aliiroseovarius halocynthiae]